MCNSDDMVGLYFIPDCSIQNVPNMEIPKKTVPANETITMRCKEGYRLNGSSELTCKEDGLFDQDFPECEGKNL